MDQEERNGVKQGDQKILKQAENTKEETTGSSFSNPALGSALEDILKQRREHREKILKFVQKLTWLSFGLLSFVVLLQSIVRLWNPSFSPVDRYELEILSAAVFGQIIGVIYLITKSLWDDKNYINKL